MRRLTLSNTGTESVSGIVELIGASAANENDWQVEQAGSVVADGTVVALAPGESTALDVVFMPQAIGETAATFRYVHSDSQYPGGTSLEVALSGEGVGAQDGRHLTLAPEYGGLSFGSAAAGDTLVQTLTVSNALAASEALSVWLDLSDQVNYAVEVNGTEITYNHLVYGGNPGAPHLVLVPGASAEVRVLYKPQTPGEHVSSVHLRHDDGDYHPEEVLVTVWGVGTDGARKRYYYLSDHLGSVRATVNETGEVLHHEDYYPFGLTMPGRSMDNGNKAARERYTGHELDEETGLSYAGARYYDPVVARWTSVDPLAAKYPSHSPYNYVLNNPIIYIDPDGREVKVCTSTTTTDDDGNEATNEDCKTYSNTEWIVEFGWGVWGSVAGKFDINILDFWTGMQALFSNPQAAIEAIIQDAASMSQSALAGDPRTLGGLFGEAALGLATAGAGTLVSGGLKTGSTLSKLARNFGSNDVISTPETGGLNLFKFGAESTETASGWRPGDRMLHLPDQGSPQANWKQNAGRLRAEMRLGQPIFDSYVDPVTGLQIKTGGFLNAERKLLESKGWVFNPLTGAYHPPMP